MSRREVVFGPDMKRGPVSPIRIGFALVVAIATLTILVDLRLTQLAMEVAFPVLLVLGLFMSAGLDNQIMHSAAQATVCRRWCFPIFVSAPGRAEVILVAAPIVLIGAVLLSRALHVPREPLLADDDVAQMAAASCFLVFHAVVFGCLVRALKVEGRPIMAVLAYLVALVVGMAIGEVLTDSYEHPWLLLLSPLNMLAEVHSNGAWTSRADDAFDALAWLTLIVVLLQLLRIAKYLRGEERNKAPSASR